MRKKSLLSRKEFIKTANNSNKKMNYFAKKAYCHLLPELLSDIIEYINRFV